MDKATKLAGFRKKSERIVHQRVKLIAEPSSEQALAAQIANTEIGSISGNRHANFAIVYDVKLSGESVTKPHLRPAPFRKDHATKCVRGAMLARGKEELSTGDVVFMLDGGRHGQLAELHTGLGLGRFGLRVLIDGQPALVCQFRLRSQIAVFSCISI